MSRRAFIESQGGTCLNWTWSWSFINDKDKVIIFGQWGDDPLILDENWEHTKKGQQSKGYKESLGHIELIEKGAYTLQTFRIDYSDKRIGKDGLGPSTIKGFEPKLRSKNLRKIEGAWYAIDLNTDAKDPGVLDDSKTFPEGTSSQVLVNVHERNLEARKACLKHHKIICAACEFNFENFYGEIGSGFIHVHHIKPLSQIDRQYNVNPIEDLIPVCPNCHAMIHRYGLNLTIDQLKNIIKETRETRDGGKNTVEIMDYLRTNDSKNSD